jgi:hypothetical protein
MIHVFDDEILKGLFELAVKSAPPGPFGLLRHAMYVRLRNRLKELDGPRHKCLTIGGSIALARICGLEGGSTLLNAEDPANTLSDLPFPDNEFDSCLSDQIIGIVARDPYKNFAETVRVLKPGGIGIHTSRFVNPDIGKPDPNLGIPPNGLRVLAEACGAQILECEGWGNWDAWKLVQLGFRATMIPMEPEHPLYKLAMRNDPNIPITTWIVVRKPAKS